MYDYIAVLYYPDDTGNLMPIGISCKGESSADVERCLVAMYPTASSVYVEELWNLR